MKYDIYENNNIYTLYTCLYIYTLYTCFKIFINNKELYLKRIIILKATLL